MLDILAEIESKLGELLEETEAWSSKRIDYHPPLVERVYRDYGEHRINLHRTHPCAIGEALYHPHPWPSAMVIAAGAYRMRVGHGAGVERPPVATTLILSKGSRYEMLDKDAWHDVTPVSKSPAYSLMVSGPPWTREAPVVPSAPLQPLSPKARAHIMSFFRAWSENK